MLLSLMLESDKMNFWIFLPNTLAFSYYAKALLPVNLLDPLSLKPWMRISQSKVGLAAAFTGWEGAGLGGYCIGPLTIVLSITFGFISR